MHHDYSSAPYRAFIPRGYQPITLRALADPVPLSPNGFHNFHTPCHNLQSWSIDLQMYYIGPTIPD